MSDAAAYEHEFMYMCEGHMLDYCGPSADVERDTLGEVTWWAGGLGKECSCGELSPQLPGSFPRGPSQET